MTNHEPDIKLARHDIVMQNLFPVKMYGCLPVPDKPHTLLHEGTDVEMVGVSCVHADKPDSAHLFNEPDHFVGCFGDVGLEHESFFDFVEEGFGFVEGSSVDARF